MANQQSNWGGQRLFPLDGYEDQNPYANEYRGGAAAPYSNPYAPANGGGYSAPYQAPAWDTTNDNPNPGPAPAKVIEETKFSKPADISRMWGEDALEISKEHFKKCVFRMSQLRAGTQIENEVTLLFATPDNPVHSDIINGTFCLEVNNETSEISAGFMFDRNMNTKIASKMTDHVKTLNNSSKDGVIASIVPEEPSALMIKQLVIGNVISTLTQPRPHGLFIKGIDNQTIVHTHAVSWSPAKGYKAVITPGQLNRVVYQSGSTASPHLEAIHGIHDCTKGVSLKLDNWGSKPKSTRENCRGVDVRSGYFLFLAYSMIDLIKQWILEHPKNELPPGMTNDRYEALKAMHEGWKASKVLQNGRSIPTDIYHSGSDLTDGYAGHVIGALMGVDQIAWTISPEDPVYRVPEEFLAFAAKYYEQTISPITMTKHDGVKVKAEFVNRNDAAMTTEMKAPQLLYFDVIASIFVPKMFAIIKEIK